MKINIYNMINKTDKFINKVSSKHNYFYDYSKTFYTTAKNKVVIICPIHGEFLQLPHSHINGSGCYNCGRSKTYDKTRLSKDIFISKCIDIHGNKYDYENIDYKNMKTKIDILCLEHGIFSQTPDSHLKSGCPECFLKKVRMTKDDFISRCIDIHGNKYDYNKSNFLSTNDDTTIICNIHGEFIQNVRAHLRASGCPKCSESKGEKIIRLLLDKKNIKYESQKKFDKCLSLSGSKLRYDFYIEKYNLCIEYDGEQHFSSVKYWGGDKNFEKLKIRDNIKNKFCIDNNINLLRISYKDNIQDILKKYID